MRACVFLLIICYQSYELQPPGTTFFWVLEQPENGGGDTLFASQVEAYNRLSPEFKKRLEGLRAVHSAVYQAEYSRQSNGPVRREPVESEVRIPSLSFIQLPLTDIDEILAPPRPCPPRNRREGSLRQPGLHAPHRRLQG